MGQPGLNRRQLLTALGGLTVAGSLGFAALGTGADALASDARTRVRYWNLFSGGDGVNMIDMLDAFRAANPGVDVKDSTLRWGNPYYTKLAMAASGNRAPELAVLHLGRLAGFAPERQLDPFDTDLLAEYGVREQDFNPTLWQRSLIDGQLYALPLDIHPQLNFYRKDICAQAGLIGDDGNLITLTSPDDWFDALKEAKKVVKKGLQTIGLHAFDQNFAWWFFMSFYAQAGGTYYDEHLTDVTFDTGKATEILEFLRRHITDGYNIAGSPDAEHFMNGGAFVWEGGWSVPVYDAPKIPYGATPLPPLFGKPATQAESHAFVLPHQSDRGGAANEAAHRLAAYIVRHAVDWAKGGHIPAYTPTLTDPAYRKLTPQSEYASAMDHMALEPPAWFAGSSGTLAQRIGPVVVAANLGSTTPDAAARRMRQVLTQLLETSNPMGGGTA
ncbi:sugar transporter [Streptomyces spinoverrucosus]|uniref:Sugar transporter n=1 Tax=Streptomyces spinoverrucosus TaxID=284043 RepID=A0A4Y3VN99_9ACTN|nr:extracellular solute-binding protein [Streptomyces spinoverrucosus]GEC08053.1 sugar transporter [Streptomyces spinoverrucosus]GHB65090.1 sugar transporter [Streptomyces spinoverrucosus]